jgi:hypothetical protein
LGAGLVVLVSRSGRVAYEGQGLEEQLLWLLKQSGVDVRAVRCDASDEQAVRGGGERRRVDGQGVLRPFVSFSSTSPSV